MCLAIHLEGWLHGEFQGIPYIQMGLHEMKLTITWLKMIAKKRPINIRIKFQLPS